MCNCLRPGRLQVDDGCWIAPIGALVGSLMMGMLNNGLILMNLKVSDQMIVRGLIILLAVAVSLRDSNR